MATGTIRFIDDERPQGVCGFVIDDAIADKGKAYQVYFDSRCLFDTETISVGARVQFEYAATPDNKGRARMKFDTMKLLKQET